MINRSLCAAALAAAVSLSLSACNKLPGNTAGSDHADPTPASSGPSPEEKADQALMGKLNGYIECYNDVDRKIHAGIGPYTVWMKDPEAGPTGREERPIGPPDLTAGDLTLCDKALPEAIAAQPSLPGLDKAAQGYLDALHALQPITHEAADYYQRDDYEDDGFARGKALHAPLMSAFGTFVEASGVFSDALDVANDRLQDSQLAKVEAQEGRTRNFYRLAIMRDAKALMDLMAEDSFDVTEARRRLDAFNAISDEAHAKVAEQEPGKLDWNSFERTAENFRRESKERLKRVAEKTPYSDIERRMLDTTMAPHGSPGKLMQEYNSLVFQSNRQ